MCRVVGDMIYYKLQSCLGCCTQLYPCSQAAFTTMHSSRDLRGLP
jgi:hypothetical protein